MAAPDGPPGAAGDLAAALVRLRQILAGSRFGLETEGAAAARRRARGLAGQLDDYLRPRLQRPDGPLLVVVCGPTGAGKSTLVNSLVRAPVSLAGALRPTTRAPVLVCNPADAPWFVQPAILPGFTRTAAAPTEGTHLQVVAAPALPAGLALLDAPDIDSVVDANRTLATELMDAADLWLFVTTAARYADAVPWGFLRSAIGRGAGVALVLDRVPPHAERVIGQHLDELLLAEGLPGSRLAEQPGDAPVFQVPESTVDHQGLLPADVVAPLYDWFVRLAADPGVRSALAQQTLDGALGTLPPRIGELADELTAQHTAAVGLRDVVRDAHRAAASTVETTVREGPLLAGESQARWDDLVAAGGLLQAVKSRSGRRLDALRRSLGGHEEPGHHLVPAIGDALTELFGDALTDAAQRTADGWRDRPGGASLAADVDDPVVEPPPADAVRDWLDSLSAMVENDAGQRSVARQTTHTISAVRLLVLVAAVVAPSRADATGTERALLDTVLADPVVRRLAPQAAQDLLDRFRRLIDQQRRHYDAAINRLAEDAGTGERLRTAGLDVATARIAAALATAPVPLPPVTPPAPEPPADKTAADEAAADEDGAQQAPAGPDNPADEAAAGEAGAQQAPSGPLSTPDEAVAGHDTAGAAEPDDAPAAESTAAADAAPTPEVPEATDATTATEPTVDTPEESGEPDQQPAAQAPDGDASDEPDATPTLDPDAPAPNATPSGADADPKGATGEQPADPAADQPADSAKKPHADSGETPAGPDEDQHADPADERHEGPGGDGSAAETDGRTKDGPGAPEPAEQPAAVSGDESAAGADGGPAGGGGVSDPGEGTGGEPGDEGGEAVVPVDAPVPVAGSAGDDSAEEAP